MHITNLRPGESQICVLTAKNTIGAVWRAGLSLCAAVTLMFPIVLPGGVAGAADAPSDAAIWDAPIWLDISIISLTERDKATKVTVTANRRQAASSPAKVALSLQTAPLLTHGIARGATRGTDYTANLNEESSIITIAAGDTSGQTSFTVNPTYDNATEGDEAIVIAGTSATGAVAPTELIIEDGPYLAFPKLIYGHLAYPAQQIEFTVPKAINTTVTDAKVSYSVPELDPQRARTPEDAQSSNPFGLTFNPATRKLTGTAPAASRVPKGGLIARYTLLAREERSGRTATATFSVAAVRDVCSATQKSWFDATDKPLASLNDDCNILLAARDTLKGTKGSLNWSTDVVIDNWDGLDEFHTSVKLIRRIEIDARGLNGTIPPVLGHLRAPASLTLALGDIVEESKIAVRNQLTGPIPPELGLPPNMVTLALSRNPLTGPIPRELTSSGRLAALFLQETNVEGHIPPEFGNLDMVTLNVTGSRGVRGHIPWQLGKNSSEGDHPGAQVFNLFQNRLSGQIPWQLGRFGNIQNFALYDNQLTGAIPPHLGKLGNEEAGVSRRKVQIGINNNLLSGAIPPELGNIANLWVLSLSQNRLTGAIPPELGGRKKLGYLYLRDNSLSGSLPTTLGSLSDLRELHAYNNLLSGRIPTEFGSLRSLEQLQMDCNDLSGRVPASIGRISTLKSLALHGNRNLDTASVKLSVPQDTACRPTYAGLVENYIVEVVVWRSQFTNIYYLSARNQNGTWTTSSTGSRVPALDDTDDTSASRHGNPVTIGVELGDGKEMPIQMRLSRMADSFNSYLLSTRTEGRAWTAHDAQIKLTDVDSSSRFRRSEPTVIEINLR